MTQFDFSNDLALVTGAPGGIGLGITRALLNSGAQVIATGPAQADLDTLMETLGDQASRCHPLTADLSNSGGWRQLADLAAERASTLNRKLSIFVHSASPRRHESQTALAVTEDEWDAMINTNLRSGFFSRPRNCAGNG